MLGKFCVLIVGSAYYVSETTLPIHVKLSMRKNQYP